MEELKLERIDKMAEYNKFCEEGNSGGEAIVDYCIEAQLQADQQVVDKLMAEIADLNNTLTAYHNSDSLVKAEITRLEAEKKEIFERLDRYVYEDELGFVGISNHIPFIEYDDFKAKYLKEK